MDTKKKNKFKQYERKNVSKVIHRFNSEKVIIFPAFRHTLCQLAVFKGGKMLQSVANIRQ